MGAALAMGDCTSGDGNGGLSEGLGGRGRAVADPKMGFLAASPVVRELLVAWGRRAVARGDGMAA